MLPETEKKHKKNKMKQWEIEKLEREEKEEFTENQRILNPMLDEISQKLSISNELNERISNNVRFFTWMIIIQIIIVFFWGIALAS